MKKYPERNPDQLAAPGIIAYADAIINQVSAKDIFSCDDLIFLAYRNEMQEEFGMEIVTPEEGKQREKEEAFRRRTIDITKDVNEIVNFAKTRRKWEEKYRLN